MVSRQYWWKIVNTGFAESLKWAQTIKNKSQYYICQFEKEDTDLIWLSRSLWTLMARLWWSRNADISSSLESESCRSIASYPARWSFSFIVGPLHWSTRDHPENKSPLGVGSKWYWAQLKNTLQFTLETRKLGEENCFLFVLSVKEGYIWLCDCLSCISVWKLTQHCLWWRWQQLDRYIL